MIEHYHATTDNLKSGSVVVTEDSPEAVVFGTACNVAPIVVVSVDEATPEHTISVSDITASGFTLNLSKEGGGPAGTKTVYWIACCIGNA